MTLADNDDDMFQDNTDLKSNLYTRDSEAKTTHAHVMQCASVETFLQELSVSLRGENSIKIFFPQILNGTLQNPAVS